MDRQRFSAIAHENHAFYGPYDYTDITRLAGLADIEGKRVLDIGCGNGEGLISICDLFNCTGTGVDISPFAIGKANELCQSEGPRNHDYAPTFIQADAKDFMKSVSECELALCIGSTGALGGYDSAIDELLKVVVPGGHIILGEGFWRRDPAQEYLMLLGATVDEMTDHATNVSRAESKGLEYMFSIVSSDHEWDEYEGMYNHAVRSFVRNNPADTDAVEMIEKIRKWSNGYLRWGRDTLGFALYLFRKPV